MHLIKLPHTTGKETVIDLDGYVGHIFVEKNTSSQSYLVIYTKYDVRFEFHEQYARESNQKLSVELEKINQTSTKLKVL